MFFWKIWSEVIVFVEVVVVFIGLFNPATMSVCLCHTVFHCCVSVHQANAITLSKSNGSNNFFMKLLEEINIFLVFFILVFKPPHSPLSGGLLIFLSFPALTREGCPKGGVGLPASRYLNHLSKYIHNLSFFHHYWHEISPKDGDFRGDAILISCFIMIAITGFCKSDWSANSFFLHNRQGEVVSFHLSERSYFLGLLNGFLPEIRGSENNVHLPMCDKKVCSL